MSDAAELRKNIRMVLDDTEREWQISTAMAKEYEQGVTIIQYAAGMPPEVVLAMHNLIETALGAISGKTN